MFIPGSDEYWMQRALSLAARAAKKNEVPVGAILVLDGEVIAQGSNRPICQHDPTAHAEMVALRRGGKAIQNYRLVEATLYVTLEPCIMCAGAILNSRVRRLVYGATEKRFGAAGSLIDVFSLPGVYRGLQVTSGVLADACSQQLTQFFELRRLQQKTQKEAPKGD